MRAKRIVASRCQAGSAPAAVTVPGSPPHSSRISAVAASIASGISAGSRPRSNRWRASETIWWRRPVSAMRIGSNSAHSTKTSVVVSSQPVASPPITPAIDCTPAASQIAQSSGSSDVVLAVQRAHRLAGAAAQGQHVAGQFADVEHVQRAAEVEGEEIGDVDQRVDRAQADARSAGPAAISGWASSSRRGWCGRGSRGRLPGTSICQRGPPSNAGGMAARRERLQRAEPGGGEVARHAADARSSRRGWG